MARYLLVTIGRVGSIGKYLEGGSNIFHFSCNGVGPIGIAILFVKFECLPHRVGYFNSKLMVAFKESGDAFPYQGDDTFTFL